MDAQPPLYPVYRDRRLGVFVRRRKTHVTRRNEMYVVYDNPGYHPYARRIPIRVEWKSTIVTTTIDEDVFVPYGVEKGPPHLFAHPELPVLAAPSVKVEEPSPSDNQATRSTETVGKEHAAGPYFKSEQLEPTTPNDHRLGPVSDDGLSDISSLELNDGRSTDVACDTVKDESFPPTLASGQISKAMAKQRHTRLQQLEPYSTFVKSEPVD